MEETLKKLESIWTRHNRVSNESGTRRYYIIDFDIAKKKWDKKIENLVQMRVHINSARKEVGKFFKKINNRLKANKFSTENH